MNANYQVANTYNIQNNSETLNLVATNPGSTHTLWGNSSNTHVFWGAIDLIGTNTIAVDFSAQGATALSSNVLTTWTVISDSASGFNNGTGTYTVPIAGIYFISCQATVSIGLLSGTNNPEISILVNGVADSIAQVQLAGSLLASFSTSLSAYFLRPLIAGNTITITLTNLGSSTLNTANVANSNFIIFRYA